MYKSYSVYEIKASFGTHFVSPHFLWVWNFSFGKVALIGKLYISMSNLKLKR